MLTQFTPFIFETATPESVGVDSDAIAEFQRVCREKNIPHQGYMIYKDGKLIASSIAEPYRISDKRHVYSVSKTFTSTAIGIAVDEGLLSVEDSVVSFFPEYLSESITPKLGEIKVKHLLTMTTGHDKCALFTMMNSGKNWVESFLEFPIAYPPGEKFVYSTAATYILSAIITKLTGMRMCDYLTPRLFNPLGINNIVWSEDPQGINYGGIGIHISPIDMLKLGVLYLNKGVWNGKHVISEKWVNEATSAISDNSSSKDTDWAQGYGYQIWRCQNNSFRADGAFGQYIIVSPEKNCVTVLISEIFGILGGNMQDTIDLYWNTIYKSMSNDPLPAKALPDIAVKPYLTVPQGDTVISKRHIKLGANSYNLSEIALDFSDDGISLLIKGSGHYASEIICGHGKWVYNRLQHCPVYPFAWHLDNGEIGTLCEIAASYAVNNGILEINLMFVTTAHGWKMSIYDDGITIKPTADVPSEEIKIIV